MFAAIGRPQLVVAGAAATLVAGAAGGTALAMHRDSGSTTTTAAAAFSPAPDPAAAASPSPSPGKHAAKARHPHTAGMLGRVTATSATSLTFVDRKGTTHVVSVGPRTKVLSADGKAEPVTSIPGGELVEVVVVKPAATRAPGSAAPAASPSASASGEPAAVRIRDTGFAVR